MIKFRKLFEKVKEYEATFALVGVHRIVTQFRYVDIGEGNDHEQIGRFRRVEENVMYAIEIDLWLFIIRFKFNVWQPSKR